MEAERAAAGSTQFEIVGIDQLHESKTNPRRAFAKDALSDLTASIAEKGVLVPLLVRPQRVLDADVHNGRGQVFEILAGARRYRAAKAAGVKEIPVVIRDLDDTQALEVQVIENLQRKDVHPLEEAEGYKALLEKGKYEIAALAGKVGKSESYIYQRLKLAELIEPAKKAFMAEAITAGHAILIARLQPEQQKEALSVATDPYDQLSVRDLSDWIQQNIFLDLHSAAFPKDVDNLVPGIVSCVDCPKRTGFAPALFADVKKKDTCTDSACFHKKADAFVQLQLASAKKDGKPLVQLVGEYGKPKIAGALSRDLWQEFEHKDAKCPAAEKAIVVDGRSQGKTLSICRDTKCKTHGRQARETNAGTSDPYRVKQLKEEKKRRNEMELRRKILHAIAERTVQPIDKLKPAHWQMLAKFVLDRMWHDAEALFAKAMGIEPKITKNSWGATKDFGGAIKARVNAAKSPAELVRWILLLAASPTLLVATYDSDSSADRKLLNEFAQLEGVKVSEIEKRHNEALAGKKAKKPGKSQTAVKPAKKAAKASRRKRRRSAILQHKSFGGNHERWRAGKSEQHLQRYRLSCKEILETR
jgi:ParB family chromosome partitioning protein